MCYPASLQHKSINRTTSTGQHVFRCCTTQQETQQETILQEAPGFKPRSTVDSQTRSTSKQHRIAHTVRSETLRPSMRYCRSTFDEERVRRPTRLMPPPLVGTQPPELSSRVMTCAFTFTKYSSLKTIIIIVKIITITTNALDLINSASSKTSCMLILDKYVSMYYIS